MPEENNPVLESILESQERIGRETNDTLAMVVEAVSKKAPAVEVPENGEITIKAPKGDQGEPGAPGKDADEAKIEASLYKRLLALIPSLDDILEAIKPFLKQGEPGKDADPEQVAQKLISSKEFLQKTKGERGEPGETVIGPRGPRGEKGKQGSADTAKEIVEKINNGEEQIDASKIKGIFGNGKGGSSKTYALKEMEDVDLSQLPSNGDVLTYSSDLERWVATPAASVITGTFVNDETPAGVIDGVMDDQGVITGNVDFTLAHTPIGGSLAIYLNGSRLRATGEDYVLSGDNITFNQAPLTASILIADYRY